jgi:hypothetical protein
LANDPTTIHGQKGERIINGHTEAKLIVAIDLAKIVDRLVSEIGFAREQRMADFVSGVPVYRFGPVEQTQLKADVRRLEELAVDGGYGFMLARAAKE